jgi:uncharacterized membrane protein YbhN (UPF0104 family)
MLVQDGIVWGAALLCLWWIARGLTLHRLLKTFESANLWLFIPANVISFFIWWLGDTLLFAALFSFFHKKTRFRELLPATAAQYFLQAVNILAADSALVVFLNRRKGVPWITAVWTMMFAGLIDALTLSGLATAAGILAPQSKMRTVLPFAAAAFGFLILVALWWAWGHPTTRLENWMYHRPSAHAFRSAGWREYLTLGSIRLTLMVVQGFLYYYSIVAFANVPLSAVLALSPGILAGSNEPITPQGLGPLQAIVVAGLSNFASRDKLLAASLGISIMAVLCRLPLGLGAAGTFARRVLLITAEESHSAEQNRDVEAQEPISAAR